MSDNAGELERELEALNVLLERELRARGFEPDQLDTIALPGELARLYVKCESLRDRLSKHCGNTINGDLLMNELERIADQLQRAFDGEAWHGPSVMSLIGDLSAAEAASRPIPAAHSIWELVMHIAAWERVGKRRLDGEPAQLSDEENFPAVTDQSENAWQRTKLELVNTHRALIETIKSIDESRLDQPIVSDPATPFSSVYVTLHGVVQHDLYHAGQIAILKKAVKAN